MLDVINHPCPNFNGFNYTAVDVRYYIPLSAVAARTFQTIKRDLALTTQISSMLQNGPLARYVRLRVAHAPGIPGTFSPPPRVSDPDMHHDTCVMQVSLCMSGSLTSNFLWSRWQEKRSRHYRRMRNPQFYVSGKRPMHIAGQLLIKLVQYKRVWNQLQQSFFLKYFCKRCGKTETSGILRASSLNDSRSDVNCICPISMISVSLKFEVVLTCIRRSDAKTSFTRLDKQHT